MRRQSLINLFNHQLLFDIYDVPIPGLSPENTKTNVGLPLVLCELFYEKKCSSADFLPSPQGFAFLDPKDSLILTDYC